MNGEEKNSQRHKLNSFFVILRKKSVDEKSLIFFLIIS